MTTTESTLARPALARPWGRWGLRATALSYLTLMIVLPLSAIVHTGLRDGLVSFWTEITNPIAFAALRLTLLALPTEPCFVDLCFVPTTKNQAHIFDMMSNLLTATLSGGLPAEVRLYICFILIVA